MAGIVVGIDGSRHSDHALDWAMREAALRHMPLTVVSVCPLAGCHSGRADSFNADSSPEGASLVERTRAAAREQTDKALAGLGDSGPGAVDVEVVSGVPAEALLTAAADAEMIVVGSRGAGGFKRLAMGSVCDYMARHAPCPVVIIRHRPGPA